MILKTALEDGEQKANDAKRSTLKVFRVRLVRSNTMILLPEIIDERVDEGVVLHHGECRAGSYQRVVKIR